MLKVLLAVAVVLGAREGSAMDKLQDRAGELSGAVWERWSNTSLSLYLQIHQNLSGTAVEKVDGATVAVAIATNISSSLSLFRHALNETAVLAESLYSVHRNQNCCASVCRYGMGFEEGLCFMSCNSSSIEFISSGRGFGIGMENVTRQCVMGSWEPDTCTCIMESLESDSCISPHDDLTSAVHIPRDVHEQNGEVLCFVQWTDQLSQQFSSNSAHLPHPLTQYLGTDSRLFRFSPATNWSSLSQCERCPLTLQDTFELGRRPWYTNTVTGDKFIVILLDVSGSMGGFQSVLARTTISQLLRALTPNDYFFIMQVGEGKRTRSVGCFRNRTRATPENVLATNEVVMSLRDRNNIGRAQFTHPLRHSLLLLDNSTECHRVLIIFSDGDSETAIPTGLVRSFNRDNEVQIFTFLMGYGPDKANLKAVACQNRGRMGRIREYSDVIPAVLLITDSLSPATYRDVHYTTYRDIYGRRALAMGLPLWNDNETFGIIGFDVPHSQLLSNALQNYSIGASGYAFVVDNNGQLVNHPAISQEFIEGLSDDSLLSLDVEYFEHIPDPAQWAELRRRMLSGGRSQTTVSSWALLEREERYILRNTTYSYAPVEDTPYIVVLVTPADLWVIDDLPSYRSEVNFAQFSPLGGRGQCETGRGLCEGVLGVEGDLGSRDDLVVLVTGDGCDKESSVILVRTVEVGGHSVGVVGHTLSLVEMEMILSEVMERGGEWDEAYLLDQNAYIIASYPHSQRGWFPALYEAESGEMLGGVFERDRIMGYEPRPREMERGGVCEVGEEGEEGEEGQWVCEGDCESTEIYVREVQVCQLGDEGGQGVWGQVNCSQGSMSYLIERVPNTSMTLVALSGSCLHGNNTGCARQPIRFQCLSCVCESSEKFRSSHNICPDSSSSEHVFLCSHSVKTHPLLSIVSIATGILATVIFSSTSV